MSDSLTDESEIIRETARRYFSDNSPVSALRKLRDDKDPLGYSPGVWKELASLGIVGTAIPEEADGLGIGYSALGAIFEESGRVLSATPLLSTAVLGASAIELSETSERSKQLLAQIAAGELLVAMAIDESVHHAPHRVETQAEKQGSSFKLNGKKAFVIDASIANLILVVARTSGGADAQDGLSIFIVEPNAPGVTIEKLAMADSRNWAHITLENVEVSSENLLGEEGQAWPVIEKTLDRARVCLASEMLGSSIELLDRTLEYLKQREQFGVQIGTFQALQHRAARMYTDIELTKSAVRAGCDAVDNYDDNAKKLASLAKARANDTFFSVSNESIQLHGGIGVTDEYDFGFFLKRARTSIQTFGATNWHRDRYATLDGY